MYIVWDRRPVKGKGGGLFLDWDDNYDGRLTCWMPLKCEHTGEGRIAHTPKVMINQRIDGKPRQKLMVRLPTIRTCCIKDGFNRAAWWFRVDYVMRCWHQEGDGPLCDDYSRDAPDILRKLRSVVPRPTAAGLRDFTAYRLAKEAEHKVRQEAEWDWYRQQQAERERRQQEEQRAKAEQERKRYDDLFRDLFGGVDESACFQALGLTPGATMDQVKDAYRKLAKVHHSDKGGEDKEFIRIKAAYDKAREIVGRRATA